MDSLWAGPMVARKDMNLAAAMDVIEVDAMVVHSDDSKVVVMVAN